MDLASFHRLLSPDGRAVLAEAVALSPTEGTLLSCHQRLRKKFPDDLVRAALEMALLRRKAADKFTRAADMYFTREALEQSSGEIISTYRASRFAGHSHVADLCCGIGGDAIGLSAVADVNAVDLDPLRLAMAAENVTAYGRRATFVPGDVTTVPLPDLDAAFLDPDRRADGKRHIRIRDYVPALDAVRARFPSDFRLGVKVAPGVPWDELRTFDAEAEFISVGGELKECVLWFGPLKTAGRRATVLPAGVTLFADEPAPPAEPGPPLAYLYDPDPAVVRSGLVSDLGRLLDARPIDADIAYLTGDRLVATPFVKAYRVEESLPFHAKRIGERLKAANVGHVTLTKRGSPVDVDELRRKWKLTGSEVRTVILTRVSGQPWALIATPVSVSHNKVEPRPA
jgi:SAM-dependent methyltransferase